MLLALSKTTQYLLVVSLLFGTVHLSCCSANFTVLNVLAMGPYPSPVEALSASWPGGPALIPAAQLAAELINNDSSILPGYRLNVIRVNSGCRLVGTLFINFIDQLSKNDSEGTTVGIVGPGCSKATQNLAPIIAKDELNLIQISIATTPEIDESPVYSNTFRTISSTFRIIDAFNGVLNLTNWTRYAVLYDSSNQLHTAMYRQFRDTFKNKTSEPIYSSGDENTLLSAAFESLKTLRLRIVFVFAEETTARNVLCAAYNQSMLFPSYQWIFAERSSDEFIKETVVNFTGQAVHQKIKCSEDEMKKAVSGSILSNFELDKINNHTDTVSRLSSMDYTEKYKKFLDRHLKKNMINKAEVAIGAEDYANPYFDAMWALALALNCSLKELNEKNLSLALDYRFGMDTTKTVGDVIKKHLQSLTFEGIGGTIMYKNDNSRSIASTSVRIIQVNHSQHDEADVVCMYINEKCEDFESSNVRIVDDYFKPEIVHPPTALGIFILLLASFTLVALVILQVLFIYHSDKKSIKATSPHLSSLIFSGCYVSLAALFSFTITEVFVDNIHENPIQFGVLCSTFIWCVTLSTTLIFGTLCVKTWRIYRIFGFFRQGRVKYVSDGFLVSFIILLLLFDFVFLVAWNLTNPWQSSVTNSTSNDRLRMHYMCFCHNSVYWVVSLSIYKGVLMVVLVYLSILIRRIKRKEFDFTKYIIALIYLLLLLYAILIPIYLLFRKNQPLLSFLAQIVLTLSTVYASCTFLFIPPLRLVWKKSDSETKYASLYTKIKKTNC